MDTSPVASSKASSGVRAAAVRRAHEASARRDAERLKREHELESTLVDFYAALARIEKIRVKAACAAEPFQRAADEAVRRMARLGESVSTITELTHLSGSQVRAALAGSKEQVEKRSSGGPVGEAPAAAPPGAGGAAA